MKTSIGMGRLGVGEDGSSVLELALVMPLLLLLLVAAVDYGQAYYVSIEISAAANAGAEYGVQNPTDTAGMQNAAALDAYDVPTMTTVATWGCECSDGTSASARCTTLPTCAVNIVNYVNVATGVQYTPLLIYPGFPSPFLLSAQSRMRVAH